MEISSCESDGIESRTQDKVALKLHQKTTRAISAEQPISAEHLIGFRKDAGNYPNWLKRIIKPLTMRFEDMIKRI